MMAGYRFNKEEYFKETKAVYSNYPTDVSRMEKELENLRIEYIPSEANFLLFNSEINWFEELKKRGILIRDCANYRGLGNGWYRMAVRLPEENDRLLECMKQVLNERS